MQTKKLDALRLWWRDINFTERQRKALGIFALIALLISAFFIFSISKPHTASAEPITPTIVVPPLVVVDVAGEVKKPGVYELPMNSRVNDAIKAAGGAKSSADLSLMNLARLVKDGEQIFVERRYYSNSSSRLSSGGSKLSGILNINRASAKEFERLPGIGPVLAEKIVEYRSKNGSFTSIEDLTKVNGIGSSKLEKFKEKIRV